VRFSVSQTDRVSSLQPLAVRWTRAMLQVPLVAFAAITDLMSWLRGWLTAVTFVPRLLWVCGRGRGASRAKEGRLTRKWSSRCW
jgi:hypothetical protein